MIRRRPDVLALVLLPASVAATRLLTVSSRPGEPDSALFPVGLWRWQHWGSAGAGIYDRQFSAGYYATAAVLARLFHVGFNGFAPLLNGVSVVAAIASAPLAYRLARYWLPPAAAFWSSLLWLFSPAVWWLGIEPHPQGPAIAMLLASLCAWAQAWHADSRRAGAGWMIAALAALVYSLLLRSDGLFCLGFFLLLGPRPGRRLRAAAALAGALACFAGLRAALLAGAGTAPQPSAWRVIDGFFGQLSWPHQLLPFFTAAGAATLLLSAAGLGLGTWRCGPRWLGAWLGRIALWSLPGALFWLLVRGNNVRHVAFLLLPVLWAGMDGWRRARPRAGGAALATLAAAALLSDAALWPASSNLTLYPTGNVVAAVRLLRHKQVALARTAARMMTVAAGGQPVCYFGSYTSPYVLLDVLERSGLDARGGPQPAMHVVGVVSTIQAPEAADVVFHDVYSSSEFLHAAAACTQVFSYEYDRQGDRLSWLGDEVQGPWRRLRGDRSGIQPVLGGP